VPTVVTVDYLFTSSTIGCFQKCTLNKPSSFKNMACSNRLSVMNISTPSNIVNHTSFKSARSVNLALLKVATACLL
jgi:hypothetical protein